MHDLDDLLAWRETLHHLGVHSPFLDTCDEGLDDLEVHIGLEQSYPYLTQRCVDIVFRQPAFAPEFVEDASKAR